MSLIAEFTYLPETRILLKEALEDKLRILREKLKENEGVKEYVTSIVKKSINTDYDEWSADLETGVQETINGIIDEAFENIKKSDPTQSKKYMDWIITRVINNNPEEISSFTSSKHDELYDTLKKFHKVKPKIEGEDTKWKDINRYDNFSDFESKVDDLFDKHYSKSKKEILKTETELIYNDGNLAVSRPESHEGSCQLGSATKWCTAVDDDGHYRRYKRTGELYVFFLKNVSGDKNSSGLYKNPMKKIQVHIVDNYYAELDMEFSRPEDEATLFDIILNDDIVEIRGADETNFAKATEQFIDLFKQYRESFINAFSEFIDQEYIENTKQLSDQDLEEYSRPTYDSIYKAIEEGNLDKAKRHAQEWLREEFPINHIGIEITEDEFNIIYEQEEFDRFLSWREDLCDVAWALNFIYRIYNNEIDEFFGMNTKMINQGFIEFCEYVQQNDQDLSKKFFRHFANIISGELQHYISKNGEIDPRQDLRDFVQENYRTNTIIERLIKEFEELFVTYLTQSIDRSSENQKDLFESVDINLVQKIRGNEEYKKEIEKFSEDLFTSFYLVTSIKNDNAIQRVNMNQIEEQMAMGHEDDLSYLARGIDDRHYEEVLNNCGEFMRDSSWLGNDNDEEFLDLLKNITKMSERFGQDVDDVMSADMEVVRTEGFLEYYKNNTKILK